MGAPMRYRPHQPIRQLINTSVRDALLFLNGAPGVNVGTSGATADATSPVSTVEGVTVTSFNSAWIYSGYSALPITVIIDLRVLGDPVTTRHALWSSRSGSAGSNGLYFRYFPNGVLELLRSQQVQFATANYTLPASGGVVAFSYDGTSYKIAADGKVLASGSSSQSPVFGTPTVGAEGGTQSLGGDTSNAIFRSVQVLPILASDKELIDYTSNPYQNFSMDEDYEDDAVADPGIVISPGEAALTLTGHAPTVTVTANQSFSPAPAELTITGYAPEIVQASGSQTISPETAQVTITGHAPSISQASVSDFFGGFSEVPRVERKKSVQQEREDLGIIPRRVQRVIAEVAKRSVTMIKTDEQAEGLLKSALKDKEIPQNEQFIASFNAQRDRMLQRDIGRSLLIRQRQQQIEREAMQRQQDAEDEESTVEMLLL